MKLLDEKAMQIFASKEYTLKELKQVIEEREEARNRLKKLETQIEDMKDDFSSTKSSYDQQIAVFSEHISGQNEKLAHLQDEIDTLKSHRVFCGKCKTWNTVEWLLTEGKGGQRCSKGNHGSYYNYISL
jgi:flagellar biosynthesis chaperone FliJ